MTDQSVSRAQNGPESQPASTGFELFVESWLANAPAELAQAAFTAAVPHQFDRALFATMLDGVEQQESLIQRLQDAGIVAATGGDFYYVPSWFRSPLLRVLVEDQPVVYRVLNSRAAVHIEERANNNSAWWAEVIYHLLGAGEPRASGELLTACELAWQEQMGSLVDRLVAYGREQDAVLDGRARATLRFVAARNNLLHGSFNTAELELRAAASDPEADRALQARALAAEGELFLQTDRWHEAAQRFDQATTIFFTSGDAISAARVAEIQGDALLQLATRLGGLPGTANLFESRLHGWLRSVQHAPFYLYRWLSRRIDWLPNLYVGTDYQDWIIISLLHQATGVYQQALTYLSDVESLANVGEQLAGKVLKVDLQLRLADLDHRVGKWSRAEREMGHLAVNPVVALSDYRGALLDLTRGRAALARSRYWEASRDLAASLTVFKRYDDLRGIATATQLLGQVAASAGEYDTAVAYFMQAAETALANDELIDATHAGNVMADLAAHTHLADDSLASVEAVDGMLENRAYIARFSGNTLQIFRRLALYVAVPFTYITIWMLAGQLRDAVTWLETIFGQLTAQSAPTVEFATNTLLLVALPLLTVWLYELFYLVVGWFSVQMLKVDELASRQPAYVVTTPVGILLRGESGSMQASLRWEEIEQEVTLDWSLWKQPAQLKSDTVLTSRSATMILSGALFHYRELKADIVRRRSQSQTQFSLHDMSFSLLRSRWSLASLAVTIAMSVVAIFNWLDPASKGPNLWSVHLLDGSTYLLPLTTAISEFYIWALYFFPLFGLIRYLIVKHAVQNALGQRYNLGRNWPIWLAIALLALLAAAEIWTFAWQA